MNTLSVLETLDAACFGRPVILKRLSSASSALAELKGVAGVIRKQAILINMLSLLEAKDISEIESIITTHDELLMDEVLPEVFVKLAAKEVLRYQQAMHVGYEQVRQRGLVTVTQLIAMQAELECNNAGIRKLAGTAFPLNRSETVYMLPQESAEIVALMRDLERFISDAERFPIGPLIKMAVIQQQFESIHPFSYGYG